MYKVQQVIAELKNSTKVPIARVDRVPYKINDKEELD